MSNDQPSRRPPAKSSGGGAPMGSTISIVVAVVAVIVGFLILRNINNDSSNNSPGGAPSTEATLDTSVQSTTTTGVPAPTTAPPLVTTGATVVVANAAGVNGAAGRFSTSLQAVGFTMGKATDAAAPEQRLDVSKVYYLPGGEAVAASVAQVMSSPTAPIATAPMPNPVPIAGGTATLAQSTVLVMLGKDLADKPLPALAAETPATSTPLPSSPINESTTSSSTG